jgi:hypothetical protein
MRGQNSRWRKGVATLAFCVLLGACDNNEQAKKPSQESEIIKRETALMSDPNRAGPELEKRLAEGVSVDGSLLLVHTITGSLFVLPVSTPWTLQCWFGMSIVFGNSVSGDGSSTDNDVTLNLTVGQIDQKNCDVLGPRIGKRLLAILEPARIGEQK